MSPGVFGRGVARLKQALSRTRNSFRRLLDTRDESELEELLLAADVGVAATDRLVDRLRGATDRRAVLEEEVARLLEPGAGPVAAPVEPPRVVMVVGVNGSGKTTTVGKLCRLFREQGQRVLVAAADTYRDAASDQLAVWAARAGVELVASTQGQDAAAVAFDALTRAKSRGFDTVLLDTAGRLHTRTDLMAEVAKIRRVCARVKPGAPDDIWLVLDATVGQNGLRQARAFHDELGLTGLVVAKLDGTARGGVMIPVVQELGVPVRFIGTGEAIEDIEPFDARAFARALLES